ncbi:hypothetical protein ANN_27054 [Periplaneta americana]|uniref:Carboxylesterase type B domain-containing protein n=1 Tax=Periplaneta americana TaxID=6978 RepID=A0ABQ8RX90_PERAM|nr:hypothetical protein ANN_27054 [Periplaneta americana]
MKDQTEALRWVQKNIAAFGGDPNKVTILGAAERTGTATGMACNVKKHINSNKHKRACNRQQNLSKVQQESPSQLLERTFYEDMCDTFIASNIPLNKLENAKLRSFSEKYTGRQIPKEATLRKNYVQHAYEKCLREVKCKLQNEKIWVFIDEGMDFVGRRVANVVVAALSAECCCRPYLLTSEGLEKNDNEFEFLYDVTMIVGLSHLPLNSPAAGALELARDSADSNEVVVNRCSSALLNMAKKKCMTEADIDEAIFDSSCSEAEDVIQEPKGQDISRKRSESEEEEGKGPLHEPALSTSTVSVSEVCHSASAVSEMRVK